VSPSEKITYTSSELGEATHESFESSVRALKARLGQEHPFYVDGTARRGDGLISRETAPGDRDLFVGAFAQPSESDVNDAVAAAIRGFSSWSARDWMDRVATLEGVAAELDKHQFELAALVALEVGKPRLEALGDVDETIELINLYCARFREHEGYRIAMTPAGSLEEATSQMRPFGAWAVISPFNFPLPLAAGPAAAALVSGNSVILKPSYQGYLSTLRLYELFVNAGIPADALHLLPGDGAQVGDQLVRHEDVAGITFTGSHAVGMGILRASAGRRFARPVIAEMGGKNATLVTATAILSSAAEGVAKAAFGYSGQKCSACSRVYVQDSVADEFIQTLEAVTKGLKVSNPVLRDTFTGPVINAAAVARYLDAVEEAKRDGRLITGGSLLNGSDTPSDQYVSLAVVEVPATSRLLRDELFVPFVAVHRVKNAAEGLQLINQSDFGLTAGLFAEDPDEITQFLSRAEAGVLYVNRTAGSTTGAWPGIQTFSGWKGSGTTSRGTGGYYYVDQYMREQSRTVMHG